MKKSATKSSPLKPKSVQKKAAGRAQKTARRVVSGKKDLDVSGALIKMRSYFTSGATRSLAFRKEALKKLHHSIVENESGIAAALHADLGKSPFESYATETGMVLHEITSAIRNLSQWSRTKRVSSPLHQFPSSSFIMHEPYGLVLILAPWNYPFQLLMMPLVGAIAAGNCVTVKTGNAAAHTGAIINKIISEIFPPEYVRVYEGGREVIQQLLAQRYDYIFFTGGKSLGRMVLSKAAETLTPVTLELGGKSPVFVTKDVNIALAARRIAWGKLLNCGQTCVAPDYVLIERTIMPQFIAAYRSAIVDLFGNDLKSNPEYPRMISQEHFDKVVSFLKDGELAFGGGKDRPSRYVEPAVLVSPPLDSPVMQEEIFGPILPVIPYDTLDDAIAIVAGREKPLQLYIFSNDKLVVKRILNETSAGGVCLNDVIVQISNPATPFGGVGESGMGSYHGRYSFETFTHKKPVMKRSVLLDLPMRYAPYKEVYLKMIKMLLR